MCRKSTSYGMLLALRNIVKVEMFNRNVPFQATDKIKKMLEKKQKNTEILFLHHRYV